MSAPNPDDRARPGCETVPLRVLLQRSILTFAEAIAATPADEPARRQPRGDGRTRRARPPATKRAVLIDGMTAAADLLNDPTFAGGPDAA